ncbi:MAG: hypothetical protein AAB364_03025 [Patescibacteria group bacterium]|mgnify:CR=1 FL=1
MKRSLIWIAVIVLLFVAQVASAQNYSAGRHSYGGGYYGFGGGVRPSFLSSGRGCNSGYYQSYRYSSYYYNPAPIIYAPPPVIYRPQPIYYSQPAVVYTQPAPVVVNVVPVKIWTEAELISVVKQRFEMKYRSELSQISDITIQRVAGSEEYHKSGAMEEVKYLVIWNFTEKSRDGVEKTTMKDKKVELEFDKFGNLDD